MPEGTTAQGPGSRSAMFLLGATLALGFAWSAYMISTAMVRMKQSDVIYVKGTAETTVKSDWADWGGSLTVRSADLKTGYEALEKHREAVRQFLNKSLKPEEFAFSAVEIKEERKKNAEGNETNAIENYVLTQEFSAASADVLLVEKLSRTVTDLIKEGIEVSSQKPRYIYKGIDKLKLDLLGKATSNAYDRARLLAGKGGGEVGSLASASQGVFQITPVNSTDVSGGGIYDTSTIEKSVRAVVTLEFRVKKK